jgi:1A family penicillin-binding protein
MGNLKTGKKYSWVYLPILFFLWILIKLGNFGINIITFLLKFPVRFIDSSSRIFTREFYLVQSKPVKKVKKTKKLKKVKRDKKAGILQIIGKIFPAKVRVTFLLGILGVLFITYSYFLVYIAHGLPSPTNLKTLPTPTTTEFYDRNGRLLYRFYEGKNRTPVKLSEIPPSLIQATISMEDKNYYHHFGVDFAGLTRAAISLMEGGDVQGGSTITQQLIKNTLLTPERTFQRKAKEIVLAFWTEKIFNKSEILEMYFNEVPFGGTAWGIAAASQTYFDKKVSELDLAESAYLAGLPASPTTYSPYGTNPELAKNRQKEVLRRMVEDNAITAKEAEEAYAEELHIKQPASEIFAPHFVMFIRSQLSERYGARYVSQGGLKVYTTLDLDLQEKVQAIVTDEVEKIKNLNVSNGAAMVTDARTGQILAMVGSKNYWDPDGGNFNVTTALRQPGSSIKPITYASAFKLGYSPGNVILDTPISFKNFWETYTPVNYDGRFHGAVSVRTALGSSYNIPAVKMLSAIGLPEMLKTAKDLGITTLNDTNRYGLSLTLGGGEVKMLDMMSVYGTFSQNGNRHSIKGVIKITDSKGNLIEDNSSDPGQVVISPSVAFMITDILADNKARTPAFGGNSLLNIPGHKVAVKTGTTDNKHDNVTYGYTPEYVVGVWVGNNNNSPMNPKLTSGVTGAAPIWNKIMLEVLKNKPDLAFEKPSDIIPGTVDGRKDLVIAGTPPKSLIRQNRTRIRNEGSGEEKEVITFTDPLTIYQSDQSGQPIQINP